MHILGVQGDPAEFRACWRRGTTCTGFRPGIYSLEAKVYRHPIADRLYDQKRADTICPRSLDSFYIVTIINTYNGSRHLGLTVLRLIFQQNGVLYDYARY